MFEKKKAMFYILDILREYSDENHLLTQKEIHDKLLNIYGVEIERKTISTTIDLLEDYGYDINKGSNGGYYLGEREFNENEIRYIVDAIYSSRSITGRQANDICKKLYSSLSTYEQKDYSKYIHKINEINRTENEEIFLNIEIINEAIRKKKKISFTYLKYNDSGKLVPRNNGYRYTVSPYFLINSFTDYYLISNIDTDDKHTAFRVDFMKGVEITNIKAKPRDNVIDLGNDFSIPNYINDHIYVVGEKIDEFKIEINNSETAMNYVFDWFRKQAKVTKKDGKIIATIKSDSAAFFYWALQYQNHIKVISPKYMVDRIKKSLKESLDKYD